MLKRLQFGFKLFRDEFIYGENDFIEKKYISLLSTRIWFMVVTLEFLQEFKKEIAANITYLYDDSLFCDKIKIGLLYNGFGI